MHVTTDIWAILHIEFSTVVSRWQTSCFSRLDWAMFILTQSLLIKDKAEFLSILQCFVLVSALQLSTLTLFAFTKPNGEVWILNWLSLIVAFRNVFTRISEWWLGYVVIFLGDCCLNNLTRWYDIWLHRVGQWVFWWGRSAGMWHCICLQDHCLATVFSSPSWLSR